MPYINQHDRLALELPMSFWLSLNTPGQLNYVFTQAILAYLQNVPHNYQAFNDCIGALEACKMELYRRVAVPYEDGKITENGDVYP